jgi:general secretion pathway protein D
LSPKKRWQLYAELGVTTELLDGLQANRFHLSSRFRAASAFSFSFSPMTPRTVRLSLALFSIATALRLAAQPPGPSPLPTLPGANPAGPSPAPAALAVPNPEELITLKLTEDSIDQVLDRLAVLTGRSILRPGAGLPTAPYTINFKEIPKSEAILAIETLLALNQVGVTPLGDKFLKVVALTQTKTEAPEMITGSALDLPPSGKIATKIFQLEFLRAAEFIPQLAGMFTPGIGGGYVVLDKANAAMITETVTNLQRVEVLLKSLDKPVTAGMTPKFYTLRNGAKASDVVNKLRTIISGPLQQQLGTATTYNADDRTNQIILISDPRQYPFFDELIAKLDIKADPNTRNEIIALKHAKAADVQKLLSTLVQGQNAAAQRNSAQSVRPGQIVLPNQPAQANTAYNAMPAPNGAAPAAPQAPVSTGPAGIDGPVATNEFSSILNVVNDDRSNSIIVSGTADDVRLIKDLVAKIDTILAQVSIEVIIAEVKLNDNDTSGIQALNLTVTTDTPNGPGGDNGHGTHIATIPNLSVAGWNVTDAIVNPLAFKAALTDAGSRNNLKVLGAPTITTTHGQEGNIIVGEKRPIVTGTQSSVNSGVGSPVLSSQYQITPITLDLKVTPFIGDDGSIQLKIDQKIEDVTDFVTIDGNQVPVIGTRQAISNLNVFDGQMIVLGGLQRTKNTRTHTKIGLIWEIPILSHLLGGRVNTVERNELLLFIRPHVMKIAETNSDALKTIETLSNRDQVKQYLADPTKPAKESVLEKIK